MHTRTPSLPGRLGRLAASAAVALGLALPGAAPALADTDGESAPVAPSVEPDALAGDPFAQFVAGRRELVRAANEHDPALAQVGLGYLVRAAEAGFSPAARFTGSAFLTGEFVPKDVERAVSWFTRAAALGDADSQRVLGEMYVDCDVVPRDLTLAVRHLEAYVANPGALHEPTELWMTVHQLAVLHAEGRGTPPDPERARALWTRAATEGQYPPAMEALARVRAEDDPAGAVDDYLAAARAYLRGGLMYDITPEEARVHAGRILSEIRRLNPGDPAIGRLEADLAGSRAMRRRPPAPVVAWATP